MATGVKRGTVSAGTLEFTVPAAGAGQPLVDWLAARFSYFDREAWADAVAAGRLQRNGVVAAAATVLLAGDRIAFAPEPAALPTPEVAVLFEDADLVVVDKPPFLVTHHDSAFPGRTFVGALAERLGVAALHFAHRLDRETSGVLLLAKHAGAAAALQAQFAANAVHKRYAAVVRGNVLAAQGVIEGPIGRSAGSTVPVRRAVVASGSPALTRFAVRERLPGCTVLELQPQTGRTHQLRVHLEHLGHPLVGDKLYGRSDAQYLEYVAHLKAGGDPAWGGRLGAGRQLLHAAELVFAHPRTGTAVLCRAPEPADFAAFVAAQRAVAAGTPDARSPG